MKNFIQKTEVLILAIFMSIFAGIVFGVCCLWFGFPGFLLGFGLSFLLMLSHFYDEHDNTQLWFAQSPESLQERMRQKSIQVAIKQQQQKYETLKALETEEQFQKEYRALQAKYKDHYRLK